MMIKAVRRLPARATLRASLKLRKSCARTTPRPEAGGRLITSRQIADVAPPTSKASEQMIET